MAAVPRVAIRARLSAAAEGGVAVDPAARTPRHAENAIRAELFGGRKKPGRGAWGAAGISIRRIAIRAVL